MGKYFECMQCKGITAFAIVEAPRCAHCGAGTGVINETAVSAEVNPEQRTEPTVRGGKIPDSGARK